MKNYLTFKHLQRSLKFLLLLSIFFGISNCKRDIDGSCDQSDIYYETSYFEKNERDLLPDWEGDSLFFYSDAGDTAYMFCKSQHLGITKDYNRSGSTWCSWKVHAPYESFGANYSSNNSELDNTLIHIYKEPYSDKSPPPFRYAWVTIYGWNSYTLLEFDGKALPEDSVRLANGKFEKGLIRDYVSKKTVMNLNTGIIILENKSGKKWTLYRYTLAN